MSNKQKITILHLIETVDPGGAENVLLNLACSLEGDGYHSIVCLLQKGWLYDELTKRGIETYVLRIKRFFDIVFLIRLLTLIIRKNVSIIHTHEFLMNVYGSVAGLLSFRPVITTIHGKFYYWEKWRRRVAMVIIARLSQIVTVSEDLRYFLLEKLNIPLTRVKVIHNGIDLTKYQNVINTSIKKTQIGIGDKDIVIGTVANLKQIKGHTYLLKAVPLVIRDIKNAKFIFVGKGEEEAKLREEASHLGISNYVCFLGFRSDINELLAVMDIFVLPSLSECFPLSVLEAMAMSVPIIVTDVGGNGEIVENGKTGFVVPPANPEALADKIIFLLKNKEIAISLGNRGHEKVVKRFSSKVMIDKYKFLYDSLLKKAIK